MKLVRIFSRLCYHLSRFFGLLFLLAGTYMGIVLLLAGVFGVSSLPVEITNQHFVIFYPFTNKPFLLGDYTVSYIITYLTTVLFYGVFLILLSGVFHAFRQHKLFTQRGVLQLSRFYITNFAVPFLFGVLVLLFRNDANDLLRILILHVIIGIFAWFMAAIFKQGLLLQEEQDLTF